MNFLPGWHPNFIASKVQVHLTFVAENSVVAGGTVNMPATILAGDLLIYVGWAIELATNDPPDVSEPTGYTTIREINAEPGGSSGYRMRSAYKIADGTEDGTNHNISTSGGVDVEGGMFLQFRPSTPIGSVTVVEQTAECTTNNPSSQTIGDVGVPANIHVAAYTASGTVTTRTYSPAEDVELQFDGGTKYLKYKLFNPPDTSQEIVVDMVDNGLNGLMSFMLLCNPS